MNSTRFVALVAVLLPSASAQSGPPSPGDVIADLLVPLHTGPAGAVGDDYGLWAAGPDWKASFHDGFRFFPYRGPDRPLVSLRWNTESITVGRRELIGRKPAVRTEDWRHELDHGPVTEVYEIRREGVEQMFVLERPVGDGEVVVTGRVRTPLHAAVRADVCQAVDFCEADEVTVRYGEAAAFDAAGRRAEVTTSFDGERIRLRLDQSFLAAAEYPVTIDPLTQATSVAFNASGGQARMTRVAVDNSSDGQFAAVAIVRSFASGDFDAYAVRCDKRFGGSTTIHSDVSTSWSTVQVDVAHIDGANRFAVATQRNRSTSSRIVGVYLHDASAASINSGQYLVATPPAGQRYVNPQISGARKGGPNGLLVLDAESTGSAATRVRSILIDGIAQSLGTAHDLELSPTGSSSRAAVVQNTNNQANWVAVWTRLPFLAPREIWMANIGQNGMAHQNVKLWSGKVQDVPMTVDGSWNFGPFEGRYALAFVRETTPFQFVLSVLRFDTTLPGGVAIAGLRDAIVPPPGHGIADLDMAHDWSTRSHWALAYRAGIASSSRSHVIRLGQFGRVTESQLLHPGSVQWPALGAGFAEGPQTNGFMVTYGEDTSAFPVRGMRFEYPPDATATSYGAGCGVGQISAPTPPYAGSENFTIEVQPVGLLDFVHHVFGFSEGLLDLTPYGLPGCRLLVALDGAVHLGETFLGLGGVHSRSLPLPDWFQGDLFVQAIVVPNTGPPFLTPGLRVQVR